MARMHRGDSGIGGRWLLTSEGSHPEMHPIVLEREGEGGGPWGLNSETKKPGWKVKGPYQYRPVFLATKQTPPPFSFRPRPRRMGIAIFIFFTSHSGLARAYTQ